MEPRKQAILDALDRFVAQRPGLEFGNYGDVANYRSESRRITKDRHDYETLRRAVSWRDSITADMLLEASRSAYSGRLTIKFVPPGKTVRGVFLPSPVPNDPDVVRIEYCAGQYFPTEYRKAACAVLASALWAYTREHAMPEGWLVHNSETGETFERYKLGDDMLRAGDWLRSHFKKEFGARLAQRWFD